MDLLNLLREMVQVVLVVEDLEEEVDLIRQTDRLILEVAVVE